MSKGINTVRQTTPGGYLWLLLSLFLFAAALPFMGKVQGLWPQVEVHSVMEAAGSLALIILVLILVTTDEKEASSSTHWFCLGLFCMSLADLLHSLVPPGELFVWFHSLAIFLGGSLSALAWLITDTRATAPSLKTLLFLTGGAILIGGASLAFPEYVPAMLENGQFTVAAWVLNLGGGIGFLAAAFWFWQRRTDYGDHRLILFIGLCALNASAGLLFRYSQLWDFGWWVWHLFRLCASLLATAYLAYLMRQTFLAAGERDQLQILLGRVEEQKKDLETIARQREEKERLNLALLGVTNLTAAGEVLLQNLARTCQIQIGVFYLVGKQNQLIASGSYSHPDPASIPAEIPPGTGLVSEAVLGKKPLLIKDLPKDYLLLKAGTRSMPLNQLYIYPFLHNREVLAVVELGCIGTLTKDALAFIPEIEAAVVATVLAFRA